MAQEPQSPQAIDIPEDLAQLAQEKGFPLDLMRRALALGFPPRVIKTQLQLPGVTAEAAEQFIAQQEAIRRGAEIAIPEEVTRLARQRDWPEELIKRAIRVGMATPMIMELMRTIRADQGERFIISQERLQRAMAPAEAAEAEERRPLDLSWMGVPTEWGMRIRPGKRGLTLASLNVGTYGDIPDYWPHRTEMPRGAHPFPGSPAMGYTIYEKAELWADNAADLYEEAIQRRWRPATDIPWQTIQPLPEEIERSLCQLCTFFCEKALLAADVVGKWLAQMSYGYHEVKVYLATAEFDAARHFEVFRKRALCNGGGMGLQGPGYFHRAILDARSWTEASVLLHILSHSFLMGLYQVGEYVAHNEAEKKVFRLAMQDLARQLSYGVQHLKYFLGRKPDRREEVHTYLNKGEAIMVHDDEEDTVRREALILLLGGGLDKKQIRDGMAKLEYFQRRWVRDYLARLAAAGLPDRRERIHPTLKKYVEELAAAAAT